MSAKKPQQIWRNPISTRRVNLSSALKVGRKHDMLHTPSPSVSTANPVGSSTSVPILFAARDKPEPSSHLFSLKDTLFFREGAFTFQQFKRHFHSSFAAFPSQQRLFSLHISSFGFGHGFCSSVHQGQNLECKTVTGSEVNPNICLVAWCILLLSC